MRRGGGDRITAVEARPVRVIVFLVVPHDESPASAVTAEQSLYLNGFNGNSAQVNQCAFGRPGAATYDT